MDALAAASISTISALIPHDLSSTAWAFSTLSYNDHQPLLQAISAASRRMLSQFNSQDLANTAWSFATCCFMNPEALGPQAAQVKTKISDFEPPGLATTAWAYSSLGVQDNQLMNALAAEVLRKLKEIEPQSLGILADAKLACRSEVECALGPFMDRFLARLPRTLEEWSSSYEAFVQFIGELKVDNFGARCSRKILQAMNFVPAPEDFCSRAHMQIQLSASSASGEDHRAAQAKAAGDALSGAALVHRRVFSYMEYELNVSGTPLRGALTKENGRRERAVGGRAHATLRAISSPISGLVDRTLCSEFQSLNALVDEVRLAPSYSGDSAVWGLARLFVSTAPCVSCLGALRQFQLLFPTVKVEVANGEEAYLFSSDS
eukprot:gnl/TRDRNA2_/TRDRNA2_175303_c1_seq1.p1 gnl/TRDRNA2_/TRDRNA2_175303_c1~~gnl/TRDRNA2_/TRDRNA2_175303_c1_seq1.p1  ORF type:complete len:377 (-),score=51.71 gnl/TRDRNA2_/TRDRNA2_175303_c1_seq1:34-1164(-)